LPLDERLQVLRLRCGSALDAHGVTRSD
jgi:hypothetical protein